MGNLIIPVALLLGSSLNNGNYKIIISPDSNSVKLYVNLGNAKTSKGNVRAALYSLYPYFSAYLKEHNFKLFPENQDKWVNWILENGISESDINGFDFYVSHCNVGAYGKNYNKKGTGDKGKGKGDKGKVTEPKKVITGTKYNITEKDSIVYNITEKDSFVVTPKPILITMPKGFHANDLYDRIGNADAGFGVFHRNTQGNKFWGMPMFFNFHTGKEYDKSGTPRFGGNLEWTILSENGNDKHLLDMVAKVYNPYVLGGLGYMLDSTGTSTFYGKLGGALDLAPVVIHGSIDAGVDNELKLRHAVNAALNVNTDHFGGKIYGRSGFTKYGRHTNKAGVDLRFGQYVQLILGAHGETEQGMEIFPQKPIGEIPKATEFGFYSGVHVILKNNMGLELIGGINAQQEENSEAKTVQKALKLGVTYDGF